MDVSESSWRGAGHGRGFDRLELWKIVMKVVHDDDRKGWLPGGAIRPETALIVAAIWD